MPNCPIIDWQYDRTGRDDRPELHTELIFKFALRENVPQDIGIQALTLKAPDGFVFPLECIVTTKPQEVFDGIKPGIYQH